MNTLEAIKTRRSIRKYKSDPLSKEQVETLLRAAMQAPSAGNGQPWEFILIESQENREAIANMHPYAHMAKEAPLYILVCADVTKSRYPDFWQQDCAAAIQNILLAAHSMGLGTVWTGIYPEEARTKAFMQKFNLPSSVLPLGGIVVGYPDQVMQEVDRFDPTRIHYEKY